MNTLRQCLISAAFLAVMFLLLRVPSDAQQNLQGTTQFYLVGTASTPAAVTGTATLWPGGIGSFDCGGTWNGATVTLQVLASDAATYLPAGTNTTFTANSSPNPGTFYWGRGLIKGVVTSAGGSTSLQCSARIVPNQVQ